MTEYPGRARIEGRLGGRLVVVAPEAHKAYGLAAAISGVRVLTGRPDPDTPASQATLSALRQVGADVCAVPVGDGPNTTYRLVEAAVAQRRLEHWRGAPLLIFRADHKTREAVEAAGFVWMGADPRVARRLENKKAFRALCREANLPVVESRELDWPVAASAGLNAGRTHVVQTARGHAGKRTWLWPPGAPPRLPRALHGRPVLVSERLDGPTWTINAVVGPAGVRVGSPMRQITGDPRLTEHILASCGVAIEPAGAEAIADELADLAMRVGALAGRAGFVGFFGIDAVGDAGGLRLIEMNARLTATLTVATLAELAVGAQPLTVTHALVCLGHEAPADRLRPGVSGGHLIFRDVPGRRVVERPLGRYALDSVQAIDVAAGWPPAGALTWWPAGRVLGSPDEDRGRALFSGPMLDQRGELLSGVEAVIEQSTTLLGF